MTPSLPAATISGAAHRVDDAREGATRTRAPLSAYTAMWSSRVVIDAASTFLVRAWPRE
jgi:hypothetical protein